jgi:hypothetical protein
MLCKKELDIVMPYMPEISVNSAYNRGDPKQGHKSEVNAWGILLKNKVNRALDNPNYLKINKDTGIILNIELKIKKRPGRKPDTSNFRKIPQDIIADCLGVDDWLFYGSDSPIQEGNDEIIFTIIWNYNSNAKDILDITRSKLHCGPLNQASRKVMGLGVGKYCIGIGTPYCLKCSAVVECPVNFHPEVLINIPCGTCKIVCPCRALDGAYIERKYLIEKWWSRRN